MTNVPITIAGHLLSTLAMVFIFGASEMRCQLELPEHSNSFQKSIRDLPRSHLINGGLTQHPP